ncbi:thioesterase II family protein [Jatrophihabitans sp.]|uniref:thioesterase II family protein n=1 Tax=Jatrophihabitans sp. TaxID=1932789 RepID=UPI002C8E9537|nr:alpha/beta fold hydrolase [Jatrophihabitans sp.]
MHPAEPEAPWFTAGSNPAAATRVFLFPFAGGNASAFLPWQASFGPGLELRVAQLPGRGIRLFDAPVADLAELTGELARAVAELADRPFLFFGHSVGALLAFETARRLRRTGRPAPVRLWVSGAEGPQTRLLHRHLHQLEEAELIEALREYNGTDSEMLANQELMQLVLPGVRADFALSERYLYRPEPPLDLPISVLLGDSDEFVEPDRAAGWAAETSRPITVHRFPGDHFFLNEHQQAIATLIADSAAQPVPGRHP